MCSMRPKRSRTAQLLTPLPLTTSWMISAVIRRSRMPKFCCSVQRFCCLDDQPAHDLSGRQDVVDEARALARERHIFIHLPMLHRSHDLAAKLLGLLSRLISALLPLVDKARSERP